MLKEFTKALNYHHRRRFKKKRIHSMNSEDKKNLKKKERKAFMGGMGTGASMAVLGGGAVAAAGAASMMGSAENEEIEKKISLKENELGILTIGSKIDGDVNQELFTASFKLKGLRDKAKTLLLNGEAQILQLEEQIDNMLGNLQAMDNHNYNWFNR